MTTAGADYTVYCSLDPRTESNFRDFDVADGLSVEQTSNSSPGINNGQFF